MTIRVSLRHVTSDGTASDLVGDLVQADDEQLVLLPAGRGPVVVPRHQVRAMRTVPPRVVRPSSGVDDLQRLMAEGWPGTEQVRLGGWTLHAGQGWSRRANSAHPTGDPERSLDEALAAVQQFYAERGQPALLQLAAHQSTATPLDAELERRGWRAEAPSIAMVLDLQAIDPAATGEGGAELVWAEVPDERWLGLQPSDEPGRLPVLTCAPAHYATLLVDGEPAGCGRLAVTRDWAGLSCLFVEPSLRGRGHGRALAVAMTARARVLGCRYGYLQVEQGNDAARRLYEELGWREHHRYLYWRSR